MPDITCLYMPESLFSRQYMGLSPMKANCTIRRRYPANLIRYIYLCLRGFFSEVEEILSDAKFYLKRIVLRCPFLSPHVKTVLEIENIF